MGDSLDVDISLHDAFTQATLEAKRGSSIHMNDVLCETHGTFPGPLLGDKVTSNMHAVTRHMADVVHPPSRKHKPICRQVEIKLLSFRHDIL